MEQSRLVSLIEAAFNTLLGFCVSWLVWPLAAAATGIQYTNSQHWSVIAIFTAVSVARSYAVRRFFANGMHMSAVRIASRLKSRE